MREIKFRAWDKKRELMHDLVRSDKPIKALEQDYELSIWGDGWELIGITALGKTIICGQAPDTGRDDGILMQYTGLTDKNGKEIYEGDIVAVDGINYPVVWSDTFASWQIAQFNGHWQLYEENQTAEIIGNIYEDPNLINEGENGE